MREALGALSKEVADLTQKVSMLNSSIAATNQELSSISSDLTAHQIEVEEKFELIDLQKSLLQQQESFRRSGFVWFIILMVLFSWLIAQYTLVHLERCTHPGPRDRAEQKICNIETPWHDHPIYPIPKGIS